MIGGDRLFVDSSRSKVRESVSGKVPEIARSIAQELCSGMQTNYGKARKALDAKKDELVAQYQPVYEKLEKQFTMEELSLTLKIKHSEDLQSRINAVLQQIDEWKGEPAE